MASNSEPVLVSRASGAAGEKGNAESHDPSISADGRFVAFTSRATNLVPEDADATSDIYVRDLQRNTTTLVSRASGLEGEKGNLDSREASISADGRLVAFTSDATNLVPGVGGPGDHIYVRDLVTQTIVAVDRASGPNGHLGNADSREPSISADASRVAFKSDSTNLHPSITAYGGTDIYVRDLPTSTTFLASRASGSSGEPGLGSSQSPTISADGSKTAFFSDSRNLVPEPSIRPQYGGIFVRDIATEETVLASRGPGRSGRAQNLTVGGHEISANGRRVGFGTNATNLHPKDDRDDDRDIYVRDLETRRTSLASRALPDFGRRSPTEVSQGPSLSRTGRYVAFQVAYDPRKRGGETKVVVTIRDLKGRSTRIVPGAVSDVSSTSPGPSRLSADGRRLAFESIARGVTEDDRDRVADVFIARARR